MKKLSQLFRFTLTAEPEPASDETTELARIELADAGEERWIEAGRSGTFKPRRGPKTVTLTKADLAGIAKNFDPAESHKITLGHLPVVPETPDLGDVVKAKYDAKRDRLMLALKPTASAIEKNQKGEFHAASMELEKLSDGTYKLGNCTLLGAHPPAIKDLARIELAEGKEETIFLSCTAADLAEPDDDEEDEDGDVTELAAIDMADYTMEERKALAKKGRALKDGSYPIDNVDDLKNAIRAFGRASDPAATKRLIVKMAKELDATDLLPADWPGSTKDKVAAAAAEEERMAKEELELAQARIKKFVENDVTAFLESDKATKKIPLPMLKAGNLKRLLLALAGMEGTDAAKIQLAAPTKDDPKAEVESSLYEGFKALFLALPDKVSGAEEEETATAERAAEEQQAAAAQFGADVDPESVERHREIERFMFAEKGKGNTVTYAEAARHVEMASAGGSRK